MSEHWQKHGNTAQKLSAAFGAATLIVALIGFSFASQQISDSRQSSAKKLFADYLRLAVEKPDLDAPNYAVIKADAAKSANYNKFVSSLLFACEEIITNFPSDKAWAKVCTDHMRKHVRFLCDVESKELAAYADEMKQMIWTVALSAKADENAPECASMAPSPPVERSWHRRFH